MMIGFTILVHNLEFIHHIIYGNVIQYFIFTCIMFYILFLVVQLLHFTLIDCIQFMQVITYKRKFMPKY